jgi:hypothetical protein
MFQLVNPTLNLSAIFGRDVFLADQVFSQVRKSRINPAQVVIAGADVPNKYQQVGVGNAQLHEYFGSFLVATFLVEPERLVASDVVLLVELAGPRRSGCHR